MKDPTVSSDPQRITVPQLSAAHIDSLIGQVVDGRFEILCALGSGGMSVVYKARHTLMDKIFALKVMHSRLVCDQSSLLRFQQEAKAASRISHPNVITVHDFGITSEGMPYLAMDFIEGSSLAEVLEAGKTLEPERALKIFQEVSSALTEAHSHGVVHRDLKPSNIMLAATSNGEAVKVLDFGIAKILHGDDSAQLQLTQTGDIFGSPLYMSPEQCVGKRLDQRSDIYSLGCVMYEAFTGKAPFVGKSVYETVNMHINDMPATISSLRKDLANAAAFDAVILKAMDKEPARRFQSMRELHDALADIGQKATASDFIALLKLQWSHLEQKGIRKKILLASILASLSTIAIVQASILFAPIAKPKESSVEMQWYKDAFVAPPVKPSDQVQGILQGLHLLKLTVHQFLTHGSPAWTIAETELKIGDGYFEIGRIDEARAEFNKAWHTMHYVADPEFEPNSRTYVVHAADTFLLSKDYQMARQLYSYILPQLEAEAIETSRDTANIYARLAYCQMQMGPIANPSAKVALEKAVARYETIDTTHNSMEHWLAVASLADIYRLQSQSGSSEAGRARALQMYSDAKRNFVALQGENSRYAGLCDYYIGQLQALANENGEAAGSFASALRILNAYFRPDDPLSIDLLDRYSKALLAKGDILKAIETKAQLRAMLKS
jgi:serine/threonine protein kinase